MGIPLNMYCWVWGLTYLPGGKRSRQRRTTASNAPSMFLISFQTVTMQTSSPPARGLQAGWWCWVEARRRRRQEASSSGSDFDVDSAHARHDVWKAKSSLRKNLVLNWKSERKYYERNRYFEMPRNTIDYFEHIVLFFLTLQLVCSGRRCLALFAAACWWFSGRRPRWKEGCI